MEVFSSYTPEHLRCPICYELPESQVFQCKDGHILCGECYPQVTECPQCRIPFGREPIRNRVLEGILEKLREDQRTPSSSGSSSQSPTTFSYNWEGRGEDIPEHVVEAILSMLPATYILKCNLVCRAWKNLISKSLFWEKCYKFHGLHWNTVPAHIRTKPEGWMVLYAHFRNKIFTKNYIRNPSGQLMLDNWKIEGNGGNGWLVENEPVYCYPLPEDSFFGGRDKSCFASSYEWCSKSTTIDLWQAGLNPKIMKICLPLEITCSQMYTARYDCGAEFKWELQILNPQKEVIRCYKAKMERQQHTTWERAEFSFQFKEIDAPYINQVRYLVFIHEGKDTKYWAGHYGMKFTRACVTVRSVCE